MIKYIIKRLLMLIPVLLCVALVVLVLIDLTPGDPARIMLGTQATEERVEAVREELGLNDPILVRYLRFLKNLLHGDLGTSFMTKRPVFDEIIQRLPYTLRLVTFSTTLSILFGIPLGVYSATHQYSWKDNAAMFAALFCVSMPNFWFALMLIRFFGVKLRWVPVSGITTWKGWILPCVSMALSLTAIIARQTRSNMLEVVRQDYITTARSKGIPESKVIYRHSLKNAIIPVVMVIGGIFGSMLGGSIIAETIFSIPGIGQYTLTGLNNRDYPVVQGSVVMMSTLFALVILLIDLAFAFIDPRIRSQYSRKRNRKAGKQHEKESKAV